MSRLQRYDIEFRMLGLRQLPQFEDSALVLTVQRGECHLVFAVFKAGKRRNTEKCAEGSASIAAGHSNNTMKSGWYAYPLSAIASAMSTTVAGVLSLVLALAAGTWAGFYAWDGEIPWPGSVAGFLMALLIPVVPIGIACVQFWGFLYLGLLFWMLHALVYQEASRWRTAGLALFPQFLLTLFTSRQIDWRSNDDEGLAVRMLATGALLALAAPPAVTPDRSARPRDRAIAGGPRGPGAG